MRGKMPKNSIKKYDCDKRRYLLNLVSYRILGRLGNSPDRCGDRRVTCVCTRARAMHGDSVASSLLIKIHLPQANPCE